ncbi:amino acid permease [Scopulibacillus cellulosilyticus]|uniref:Amino acid permease n=1 Tax=Scopulibacillus cellulosilyticus TaxID=2665665 RepID=A0ABW2PPU4_9BACL
MSNAPSPSSHNYSNHLNRALKARHLNMIAIGGCIGTGIFLASGATINSAGPGGALVAYIAISVMVYFLMTSLGEMATFLPITGSFNTYASRFVDPAFGFALGWNYWYNWAVTIAVEVTAGSLLMKFWFPHSSSLLWSVLFLLIMFGLNYLSVKGYGEGEYWFSIIKVVCVIVFIIVGAALIFGILSERPIGFKNFTIGDAPFHGGFLSIISVFMIAGFSFQGTELVGIAAGESENPSKTIPKATRQVFWRLLIFFVLTILIIGLIIPYTDGRLIKSNFQDVGVSPFVIVFEKAGLAFAASIMNAVILTSVISAGNSGMYACTRTLWSLAKEGKAPKFLMAVNKRGIPIYALIVTALVGMLAFLSSLFGEGTVYIWLLNASSMAGFISWVGIAVSHYRFRKAFVAQGNDINALPYKAKLFPFGPIFAFILCIIVILGQNYNAFLGGSIDWHAIIVSYIGLPFFLLLWNVYKLVKRTKIVPLKACDFSMEDEQLNK